MRRSFLVLLLLTAIAPAAASAAPPPIKHVFVITLENEDAASTFGPRSNAPFLARDLPAQGLFVPNYYGIGHNSLTNYIAMVSGQGPNLETQLDCIFYHDVQPATLTADGQATGNGCIYPKSVRTIANQLEDKGLTWHGYMEDMGLDLVRDGARRCAHPIRDWFDLTQSATAKDQYASRHNPFVYFHSILDGSSCVANDVPLTNLPTDLASEASTPNFSFITPDLCNDGHDEACADGGIGGMHAANEFLKTWVPRITGSPAFKKDGLLVVTFDEADSLLSDSTACCGSPVGPGSTAPGLFGPGGGRVGAVLLSPFIKPGTTTSTPYNHYGLLRSIEDLFSLPHLGFAAANGLAAFGGDVYTRPGGPPPEVPNPSPQNPTTITTTSSTTPTTTVATTPPPITSTPVTSTSGPAPTCTSPSLAGAGAALKAGTLLQGLRLDHYGTYRRVIFTARDNAKIRIRARGFHREIQAKRCAKYRVMFFAPTASAISITATVGKHSEHRRRALA